MDKKRITLTFLIVLTNAVGATAILPMLPNLWQRPGWVSSVTALAAAPS